ncbi:hypothetical protein ACHHYP_00242 [Achlya hypogyna]|uniref:PSP1 C-terminal domain-containing protein n=1 Tax=Achlya hypogyna TaxID=1202772 RepID=A0A1V9ZB63_ACHHY|nr:hypothetical protein ACHHYP_00242 [Achlya hypogyna]
MLARWTLPPVDGADNQLLDDLVTTAFPSLALDMPRHPRRESKLETWKGIKNATSPASSSGDNQRDAEPTGDDPALWPAFDYNCKPALNALAPTYTPVQVMPRAAPQPLQAAPVLPVPNALHVPAVNYFPPLPPQPYGYHSTVPPFEGQHSAVRYYEVEFKRCRRCIFAGYQRHRVGDYVRVEADRGFDVGHVVLRGETFDSFRSSLLQAYGDTMHVEKRLALPLKHVIRAVSATELQLLAHKLQEEAAVLQVCREMVRQRCLSMVVIDAEYQFDRHKLTFFFEADRRIDFRELVRDLFGLYKTRIWLQQIT